MLIKENYSKKNKNVNHRKKLEALSCVIIVSIINITIDLAGFINISHFRSLDFGCVFHAFVKNNSVFMASNIIDDSDVKHIAFPLLLTCFVGCDRLEQYCFPLGLPQTSFILCTNHNRICKQLFLDK